MRNGKHARRARRCQVDLPMPPWFIGFLQSEVDGPCETIITGTTDGEENAMLIAFTRPEPAWRYLEEYGVVEEGWQVVELRDWHEVWTFVGAWPTCRYVCFDPPPAPTAENVALRISELLPDLDSARGREATPTLREVLGET